MAGICIFCIVISKLSHCQEPSVVILLKIDKGLNVNDQSSVTLLGWLQADFQREQKKSCDGSHDNTMDIIGAPKSCAFRGISKRCWIDWIPRVELSWNKVMWEVIWNAGVFCLIKVKREKGKSFNQTFQESNIGMDWW